MKRSTLCLAVISTFPYYGLNAEAQTTVSTTPVGFVSVELTASGYNFIGVGLTLPPLLTSSTTSLEDDKVDMGIDLSALDANKKYALEIKEGTYEGYSEDILSWTGQVITLMSDVEAGGINPLEFDGSRVCIRELPTIASIFGTINSAGLKEGNLTSADRIYLYRSGGFLKYYYSTAQLGQTAGWKDENGNDASSTTIHFGDGIVIETKDSAPKEIVISGSVKLGPTNVPLYEGFNLISNPSPVEGRLTLGTSGIQDNIKHGNATSADVIYIPSESGFDRYYYSTAQLGQTAGWKEIETGDPAETIPLPDAGSFFIFRRSGQSSVMISEDLPNL